MGSPKKRIQYRYDSVGNRIGMTDPDGGRFTYAYDAVNRITQVINPQGDRTSYSYDARGRRTVKKLANGTRASFSYDAASNLTRLANLKSDGTTISSFNYEYDRIGNRTAVLESDGSRVTWSYDDTYQLTGEHRTGTTPYEDSYTYDAAGNRLLKVHDGARTTYSYDAANQLEWSEDASGRTTYTFDADGNQELVVEPTGDRTTTSWDYENRTTLVQLPSGIRNTMAYQPGGLRVKLEESTGTKKFVWDNQNYLAETDENDDTQVVYTNEPRLYGNLVSQRRGTESHWYHFDAIGSTRELTDSGENVTDTRLYDAWGSTVLSFGPHVIPLEFIGELGYIADKQRNGRYVRHRSLATALGRWSTPDPVALADSVLFCPYHYVSNRPVSFVDPSGLAEEGLSIEPVAPPATPQCTVCAGAAVDWHITPPRQPYVLVLRGPGPHRIRPGLLAVIQHICVSYEVHLCIKQSCTCVSLSSFRRSCCLYEYLRTVSTSRNLQPPLTRAVDQWRTPAWELPPLPEPPCLTEGTYEIRADVRTFEVDETIRSDLSEWTSRSQETGDTYTCGYLSLSVDRHTIDKPVWWDDAEKLWDKGWNWMTVNWNCCGDFTQSVLYQSSSHTQTEVIRCEGELQDETVEE